VGNEVVESGARIEQIRVRALNVRVPSIEAIEIVEWRLTGKGEASVNVGGMSLGFPAPLKDGSRGSGLAQGQGGTDRVGQGRHSARQRVAVLSILRAVVIVIEVARVARTVAVRVLLTNVRNGGAVVYGVGMAVSVGVVGHVAHIAKAVSVAVLLARVGQERAVVEVATDPVPVDVVVRIHWTGIASITGSVAIEVILLEIRRGRTVVEVAAHRIPVNIVQRIKGTAVADIAFVVSV
jgi:hypothetical protein